MNKPKSERVDEILKRVKSAPSANDRQSAHMLVLDILEYVENTFTTLASNHMDRMKFFSLGVGIWVDENKNPTHVILNNYKAIIYEHDSSYISDRSTYEMCANDKCKKSRN